MLKSPPNEQLLSTNGIYFFGAKARRSPAMMANVAILPNRQSLVGARCVCWCCDCFQSTHEFHRSLLTVQSEGKFRSSPRFRTSSIERNRFILLRRLHPWLEAANATVRSLRRQSPPGPLQLGLTIHGIVYRDPEAEAEADR